MFVVLGAMAVMGADAVKFLGWHCADTEAMTAQNLTLKDSIGVYPNGMIYVTNAMNIARQQNPEKYTTYESMCKFMKSIQINNFGKIVYPSYTYQYFFCNNIFLKESYEAIPENSSYKTNYWIHKDPKIFIGASITAAEIFNEWTAVITTNPNAKSISALLKKLQVVSLNINDEDIVTKGYKKIYRTLLPKLAEDKAAWEKSVVQITLMLKSYSIVVK